MFILCSTVIYFVCFLSCVCIHIHVYMWKRKTNSDAVPQTLLTVFFEDRISCWFETHQVGKAGWSVNLRDDSVSTFPVLGVSLCIYQPDFRLTEITVLGLKVCTTKFGLLIPSLTPFY